MSDTLLVVLAHSGAQDCLYRHWPFWEKAECDILGVGREDTQLTWPHPNGTHNFVGKIDIGKESYAAGDNHLRRFLEVLRFGVHETNYEAFCIIEYDCLLFNALPDWHGGGGMITTLAGGRSDGFHAPSFFHTPWHMDRDTAEKMIVWGNNMLNCGLLEHGFLDRWLGLMHALYGFEIIESAWYSRNTIEFPDNIEEAKKAIERGAPGVHGVKSADVFRILTQ